MSSIDDLARVVLERARAAGLMIATAESCTGGLIAAALTEIPGSSDVFERGFVTYANAAKREMLGVPEAMLVEHGAVSLPVARAMAEGALAASLADAAVSVTGIAGPGGGTVQKPVGFVCFATARRGGPVHVHEARYGDLGRTGIRAAAAGTALKLVLQALDTP